MSSSYETQHEGGLLILNRFDKIKVPARQYNRNLSREGPNVLRVAVMTRYPSVRSLEDDSSGPILPAHG
jgi:hypothetical protein